MQTVRATEVVGVPCYSMSQRRDADRRSCRKPDPAPSFQSRSSAFQYRTFEDRLLNRDRTGIIITHRHGRQVPTCMRALLVLSNATLLPIRALRRSRRAVATAATVALMYASFLVQHRKNTDTRSLSGSSHNSQTQTLRKSGVQCRRSQSPGACIRRQLRSRVLQLPHKARGHASATC